MGRNGISYSAEDLNRNTRYCISTSGDEIAPEIIDLLEAEQYANVTNRPVVILGDFETYHDFRYVSDMIEKEIPYTHVMNVTKPAIRMITGGDASILDVTKMITERFKNGLLVIGRADYDDMIYTILSQVVGSGIDMVVHRPDFDKLSDIEVSIVTDFRIHSNSEFEFSLEHLLKLQKKYGDVDAMGLMITQYLVNGQIHYLGTYSTSLMKEFGDDFDTVLTEKAFAVRSAFFYYYNVASHKIIGIVNDEMFDTITTFLFKEVLWRDIPEAQQQGINVEMLRQTYLPAKEES